MKIRRGKLSDANELLHFLNKTPELAGIPGEEFYTLKFVKAYLSSKDTNLILIAENNKKIIGFLMAELWKKFGYSYFGDLYVNPAYRRTGLATKLFKEYEKLCKKMKMKKICGLVLINNKKMQNWCKKQDIKLGNKFYFIEKTL